MKQLFVSFSYIGTIGDYNIYEGFDNLILNIPHPLPEQYDLDGSEIEHKEDIMLEYCTNEINEKMKKSNGFSDISCLILSFSKPIFETLWK